MKYTKKQIKEAVAYWEKQLKAGSRGKINEALEYDSLDEVFGDIVDGVICQDRIFRGKLERLYRKENPNWDGDWEDDDFVNWRCGLVNPIFDGVMEKMLKAAKEHILGEVKSEIDRRLFAAEKMNESLEYEGAEEDISSELEARDDIPNYLKPYIREQVLADVGHDGIGYHDWDLDQFAEDLKDEREILVTMQPGGNGPAVNVPTGDVPLKVTPQQIEDYVEEEFPGSYILNVELRFDSYGAGSFCYSPDRALAEDTAWCQEMLEAGMTPMDMGPDGDATAICDGHGPLAVNPDGTFG